MREPAPQDGKLLEPTRVLFNSCAFIFVFLPLTLVGVWIASRVANRWAVATLVLASFVFYASGSAWSHVALLVASIVFNFIIGSLLTREGVAARCAILWFGVAVDLAVLAVFKYTSFFLETFGVGGIDAPLLPLGISFYTFTQIAFLVDAYRGGARAYDPVQYGLFVTYFPHLIAGPILSHKDTIPQFDAIRLRLDRFATGLSIFGFGLAKKLLLADSIAPYADTIFAQAGVTALTMPEAWFGALAYAMQIYFDFSAYSDMAIGLSWMLGIRIPINFNSPYKAVDVSDFWRRWHISLSRFLRDYLYIPLGGNRKGRLRRAINLMVTMLLGGLWHGAGWTFVAWGGLHGLYLVLHHLWHGAGLRMPRLPAQALTFIAVTFAWVLFRAETFEAAMAMFRAMLGFNGLPVPNALRMHLPEGFEFLRPGMFGNNLVQVSEAVPVLLALMAIAFFAPNVQELFAKFRPALESKNLRAIRVTWRPNLAWSAACGLVFIVSVLMISGESPFLYFRF